MLLREPTKDYKQLQERGLRNVTVSDALRLTSAIKILIRRIIIIALWYVVVVSR